MKKKLLITLRHPGPADALLPTLPDLVKYFNTSLVITDTAIDILEKRYNEIKKLCNIYYPGRNLEEGFVKFISANCFKTEFDDSETKEYEDFYRVFNKLVQQIKPDIGLRTTPAYKWGIDEILPRAMKNNFHNSKILCYQEYYGIGKAFKDNENSVASIGCDIIATVDKYSVLLLKEKGIQAHTIGWLSHNKFNKYELYCASRKKARDFFDIKDSQKVILYAVISTGSAKEELKHFRDFLDVINNFEYSNIVVFIKYHPRTCKSQIVSYEEEMNRINIQVNRIEDNIPYNWVLALPDVIYSAASNMNIDLLAYQCCNRNYNEFENLVRKGKCGISIYSYDKFTKDILYKATKKTILPSHEKNSGHIITTNTFELKNVIKIILNSSEYALHEMKYAYINFHGSDNSSKLIELLSK